MSTDPKLFEPSKLVVGDTWKWRRSLNLYPASVWNLTYEMVSEAGSITLTGSDYGDDSHLINIAPATTADYDDGQYMWQAFVSDGTDRHNVGRGYIEVEPNFADIDGGDYRTQVKKQLDAVNALLTNKASSDQLSMSIAGRSISRMSPDELVKWQKHLRNEWRREQAEMRKQSGHRASGKIRQRL